MELYKRYVDVIVMQQKSGHILPLYLCWEGGRRYKIDRILSTERRSSPVGGCGIRYACMPFCSRINYSRLCRRSDHQWL